MRGASWSLMFRACLVALVCHVVVALILQKCESLWAGLVMASLAAFFPIIVAVNMGYQAACEEMRRQKSAISASFELPSLNASPPPTAIQADRKGQESSTANRVGD
jgi:hypothetical protein